MEPMFKWAGGKRKEIKIFKEYYPDIVKGDFHFIEPFVGGGAVFFDLKNKKNTINDFDNELISFYSMVKEQNTEFLGYLQDFYDEFIKLKGDKEKRGLMYYDWRDNKTSTDIPKKAARFYILNQLSFGGLRRFNSKGKFNVAYGNYKNINISKIFDPEYINLLKNTTILTGGYENALVDQDNCFIFIDPPYTKEFKIYSHDNCFDVKEQELLAERFKALKKSKAMIVIDKSELTERLYKDYIKLEYDVRYSSNVKNRYSNNAKHLIITNY